MAVNKYMQWATGVAAVLLCVAAALALTVDWRTKASTDLLAMGNKWKVRAVGGGCLGRDCNLSRSQAQADLMGFFDSLSSGPEGESRIAKTPATPVVHHKLLKGAEAKDDMNSYYDKLPGGKTERVLKAEKESSSTLPKLPSDDALKDMGSFYDGLDGHVSPAVQAQREHAQWLAQALHKRGREAKRRENERMHERREASEAHAQTVHQRGQDAREREQARMHEREVESERAAKKDHEAFEAEGKQQLKAQAEGKHMEAVPTTRSGRTDLEARKADQEYFSRLDQKAKTQKAVDEHTHAASIEIWRAKNGVGGGVGGSSEGPDGEYFDKLALEAIAQKDIDAVKLPTGQKTLLQSAKELKALKKEVEGLSWKAEAGTSHDARMEWERARSDMEKRLVNKWLAEEHAPKLAEVPAAEEEEGPAAEEEEGPAAEEDEGPAAEEEEGPAAEEEEGPAAEEGEGPATQEKEA